MKNRLKELRGVHNLSQAALAEQVGVSRQAIHAVEAGKHVPSLDLAFRITAVFGLAVEEIFFPDP